MKTAIILAGGVAKGAFEAGVLSVIAQRGFQICQIVGSSSGALNATMYAAAVRSGQEIEAANRLQSLWLDDADWMRVFHFSWRDIVDRVALSDSSRIYDLLRAHIPPLVTAKVNDVGLRLVVGAINGHRSFIGNAPATTFEGVLPFTAESFETEAGREAIYTAAVASAAFPIVFAPVNVPGLGPCYDGGVVNDAPVALASESGADRVIVVAPYPTVSAPEQVPTGVDLVMHLVDVLIHERLYRDLQAAARTNEVVDKLTALADENVISRAQLAQVLAVIDARKIEILQIRPDDELPGDTFAGFLHRDLRAQYIEAGKQAAERALTNLTP